MRPVLNLLVLEVGARAPLTSAAQLSATTAEDGFAATKLTKKATQLRNPIPRPAVVKVQPGACMSGAVPLQRVELPGDIQRPVHPPAVLDFKTRFNQKRKLVSCTPRDSEPIAKPVRVPSEPDSINPMHSPLSFAEFVPDAANGVSQLGFSGPVHLIAHVLHVNVNNVCRRVMRRIPHFF